MAKLKREINQLYKINKTAHSGWQGVVVSLSREKLMLKTGVYLFEKGSNLFLDCLELGL